VACQVDTDGNPIAWIAKTYLGPGEVANRYFSVRRFGPEAKLLAIAERQAQLSGGAGAGALSIPRSGSP